jgi:hypothetical protein
MLERHAKRPRISASFRRRGRDSLPSLLLKNSLISNAKLSVFKLEQFAYCADFGIIRPSTIS